MINIKASQLNDVIQFCSLIKAQTILDNIISHGVDNQHIIRTLCKEKNNYWINDDNADETDRFLTMSKTEQFKSKINKKFDSDDNFAHTHKSQFKSKINNQSNHKLMEEQPAYNLQNKQGKQMKNNKKQSAIKRKHRKFEKIPSKAQNHITGKDQKSDDYILSTPRNYDKHQYLSAKLLLNNQFIKKNKQNDRSMDQNLFQNSFNTDCDYRSLSSTPNCKKKNKKWESPTKSNRTFQNNSIKQYSSISNQLENSQQIQVVRHRDKFYPSMPKKKDVIDQMEKIKNSQKTNQSIDERYLKKATQLEKHILDQQDKIKQSEKNLNKLYFNSIGNKYIQKMVENYVIGKNKA